MPTALCRKRDAFVVYSTGVTAAQPLAVTMCGPALREISQRHRPKVVVYSFRVGFLNGIAIGEGARACP